ncbi:protein MICRORCHIDIA 6-like [Asparagus officinalis]|uniref:protein MICRORCHIDIA 6-like n=1 Tax=Asparagus officinalis TaxID=4686 RepID=UPI00098E5F28|nr:protein MICRORCHIDIA 6-like [Asparagus officinalis]
MEMSFSNFIDLSNDDEMELREVVRPDFTPNLIQMSPSFITLHVQPEFEGHAITQGSKEHENPYGYPISSCVTDIRGLFDNGLPNLASLPCSSPMCRQFWKAGDYEAGLPHGPISQNGLNRLRVHPKFLHSNATSHKWAFGAVAELLDNAIDEVGNGASFVAIDKITNLRDGNPALLIQDDGGGMDPERLRHCMSFGFSDKLSDSSIGQYGNGFKTSTMRLGADAIVFSRCMDNRNITQSIGLLSYTFLRQTGSHDIVVPMVDYEIDPLTGSLKRLLRYDEKHFCSNLLTLLKWSPYATEAELLKQFDDMGHHGTKVIVFNLWFNDGGDMELDFDTDAEDIMISGAPKVMESKNTMKMLRQTHSATRFRYSLRVYSSFLYLHLPTNFRIILRGQVVQPHHIINDLNFIECIKYKPQVYGIEEPSIITTIGFLEGAPSIGIHGFNVYHKNRLILPFWPVISTTNGKCRGVAGVLEVNFMKPTHNKQDFERSNLYDRLETRLKDMAVEYWNYHCHLIGLNPLKKPGLSPVQPFAPQMLQPGRHNGFKSVVFPFQQLCHPGIDCHTRMEESSNVSGAEFPARCSQVPAIKAHLSADGQVVTSSTGQFTDPCDDLQTEPPRKRRHENHTDTVERSKKQVTPGEIAGGLGSNQKSQVPRIGKDREESFD